MVPFTGPISLKDVLCCSQIGVREQDAGVHDFRRQLLQERDLFGCSGGLFRLASYTIETFEHHPTRVQGWIEANRPQECSDCVGCVPQAHVAIAALLMQEAK